MYTHVATAATYKHMHSCGVWQMELRLKVCKYVATVVSCGHMRQCSPLTGVRTDSRHLRICRGLVWCYAHGQSQRPGLASVTYPGAQGIGNGTSWGSTLGGGVWLGRTQALGICKCGAISSKIGRVFTVVVLSIGFLSSKGFWGLLCSRTKTHVHSYHMADTCSSCSS